MLGHKACLSKFKETEIIGNLLSDHNSIRPDIKNKKKVGKTNMWNQNSVLLNNKWVTEESKRNFKKLP